MDKNILIQYTIVAILILGAIVWIAVKAIRASRGKGKSCCGCVLSDKCGDANLKRGKSGDSYSQECSCKVGNSDGEIVKKDQGFQDP